MAFVRVADGVLVATSRVMATTSTLIRAGDRGVLVDPAWCADELVALADAVDGLGVRVTAGFSTHPHHDHLLWHPRFGGVPRWASPRAVAVVADEREVLLAELLAEPACPGADEPGEPRPAEPGEPRPAGPAEPRPVEPAESGPADPAEPLPGVRVDPRRPTRGRPSPEPSARSFPPEVLALFAQVTALPDAPVVALPEPFGADGPDEPLVAVVHDAHAAGHLALWAPERGVLLVGDMLSDVELPLPFDPDDLEAYLTGLDTLAPYVARARVLVPGHGTPTSDPVARLDVDRRYLAAVLAGRDPDDPRRANPGMPEVHARVRALAAARFG
ncbi:MBL fold metallo-hydrolase [Isoptericola sp. b441]|uniref:MBL fold metallo-hydrolase n=1 Tax=Actinotalea lenta TaxID=3064654 RepID=A0ABT9DDE8_9CELL|nr:MBL fold metallo-hydrolase [Isoptericola sp. b441]MDO8107007.1 MBL fold metallo-hydrolase [Isoptericola sp. b441]